MGSDLILTNNYNIFFKRDVYYGHGCTRVIRFKE